MTRADSYCKGIESKNVFVSLFNEHFLAQDCAELGNTRINDVIVNCCCTTLQISVAYDNQCPFSAFTGRWVSRVLFQATGWLGWHPAFRLLQG